MGWREVFRVGLGGVAPPPGPPSGRARENEPGAGLQDWQREAWKYHGLLGEIHYASGFYARMLSGCGLLTQELDEQDEWVDSIDDALTAVTRDLENATGGLAQLQGDYGRLIFVQGEAQLCVTLCDPAEQLGDVIIGPNGVHYVEQWEMLSADELAYSKGAKEYTRRRSESNGASADDKIRETDPEDPQIGTMTAWRFYHRHPRFSGMADSSIRAVLQDCAELLLLKKSIRNMARSRGAGNGILVLPDRMGGNEVDAEDGKKIPKNAKAIYDALTRPIRNENDASAVAPVIVFAPNGTTSSDIFHVDIRGSALYKETGLRDECIRRIAIGLDMPPEMLLGVAESNHWTAWQIDDASWNRHGEPVMREFVGQLTSALLAPVAIANGKDPTRCRIWYDATDVVQDPNRANAAADAFDRIAISETAYREATGWDEDDAPDEAEWQRRAEVMPGGSRRVKSANDQEPGAAAIERIIGLSEACFHRCRELAGSRLRTRMEKATAPANLRVRIKGVHNSDVAAALGVDVRDECDTSALVAGASGGFMLQLTRMELDPHLCETLAQRIEEHAARTLFDPSPSLSDEVLAICALVSRRM